MTAPVRAPESGPHSQVMAAATSLGSSSRRSRAWAANVVCPGSTRGPMLAASAAVYDLPDQETFAAQALLRRLLEPSEVAAAITWLCGSDSGALTGAVIPVDAGLTA